MINFIKNFKYKGLTTAILTVLSLILLIVTYNRIFAWTFMLGFCYLITRLLIISYHAIISLWNDHDKVEGIIFSIILVAITLFVMYGVSNFIFNF